MVQVTGPVGDAGFGSILWPDTPAVPFEGGASSSQAASGARAVLLPVPSKHPPPASMVKETGWSTQPAIDQPSSANLPLPRWVAG